MASLSSDESRRLSIELEGFANMAGGAMLSRLRQKMHVWGDSWRTGLYTDQENVGRLRRAVDHLVYAVDRAHDDSATPAEMSEPWKRAADVANQAFMLADPLRGWDEDAARRQARIDAAEPVGLSSTDAPLTLLETAIQIIETADNRAMAVDGPVSRAADEMSDAEWRQMYVALTQARDLLSGKSSAG